jgi:urea transport system ATP-binding protein
MLSVESIDLFYGAAQALRSVSLKAQIGRIMCVLGRNGVGKSSLLRAICGHQPIASGAIRWMDEDIKALPAHLRAQRGIGYVPQGREIFPLLQCART